MKYIILTIVIFFIGIRLSMPQENLPTNINNVLDSTYTKLQLPPLQVFLNAVYNNASVQIRKEITEEEKSALQVEKKNWLNYFSVKGMYQYGVTSGNISQSDTESPLFYTYTGTNQHLHNIGINMNIPLNDLFLIDLFLCIDRRENRNNYTLNKIGIHVYAPLQIMLR